MPDIRQLERFVAVADLLSFRRAAAKLHVSQPPLSDSIKKLEEEIGTPLFRRTRRRVELTTAGAVFLGRARLILSQLDDSVALTQAVAKGQDGYITVGFFPSATYDVLPRILRRYREAHPNIGLRFVELTTPEQPAALHQRRIDIGLFLVPTVSSSEIAQETFYREKLIVVLPEDHPLAQAEQIKLTDLRLEPFVLIPPRFGTGYHARVSYACLEAGFTPNVVEEVQHLPTIVSLVGAGMGITIGAESLRRFQLPSVVFRELEDPDSILHIDYGLAWRNDDESPAVMNLREIAASISDPE
jgi:DNA-binding transcriptional LysR family regulator